MKHSLPWFGLVLTGALFVITGCGPIQATQRVSEAEVALMQATMAGSETTAPYEFFIAKEFLHKAKEEWGYSDFEASLHYAVVAKRSAEEAIRKTAEDPWMGSPATKADILDTDPKGKADPDGASN
jgi:hypothetical protein